MARVDYDSFSRWLNDRDLATTSAVAKTHPYLDGDLRRQALVKTPLLKARKLADRMLRQEEADRSYGDTFEEVKMAETRPAALMRDSQAMLPHLADLCYRIRDFAVRMNPDSVDPRDITQQFVVKIPTLDGKKDQEIPNSPLTDLSLRIPKADSYQMLIFMRDIGGIAADFDNEPKVSLVLGRGGRENRDKLRDDAELGEFQRKLEGNKVLAAEFVYDVADSIRRWITYDGWQPSVRVSIKSTDSAKVSSRNGKEGSEQIPLEI